MAFTYFLPAVDLVDDLELRHPPLDHLEQLLRREAHGVHVVRPARQVLLGRDHHLKGTERVGEWTGQNPSQSGPESKIG